MIDLGVYKTLLTEEQWKLIQPEGAHEVLELKKGISRLVPDGATKMMLMLERARGQHKAVSRLHQSNGKSMQKQDSQNMADSA